MNDEYGNISGVKWQKNGLQTKLKHHKSQQRWNYPNYAGQPLESRAVSEEPRALCPSRAATRHRDHYKPVITLM